MSDESLDPDALASANLDDEVSVDERAMVAADDALLAAVDERTAQFRAVRALLADVEPAAISTREEHLAAALSAWDRIPEAERTGALRDMTPSDVDAAAVAGAAAVTAPSRRSDRRRTTPTRWLSAAAALLAVVAVGGLALRLANDPDSGSDAGVADESGADATDGPAELELRSEAADAGPAEAGADGEGGAEEPQADAAPSGGTFDTGIDDAAPPAEDSLVLLLTTEDLADFAAMAVVAREDPATPGVPAATSAPIDFDELTPAEQAIAEYELPDCDFDIVVGPAMYIDVPVVVGIDESRDIVIAARIDDCAQVVSTRLR
jgi:hypothetical protein